jgi:putative endopeptidase
VNDTPIETWKEYLRYHLVSGNAEYLSQEIDDAHFAFHGRILKGQEEQRERWKRAVNTVGDLRGLGEAIGQVYVKRHFPPDSKRQMRELVENLRAAFRERIGDLEWMGEETRKEALAKLEAFRPKIGYPDEWRDLSKIAITAGDLFANVQSVRAYFHAYDMARLARPTDKEEWFMTPQTVNAYYNPSFNEIVFPAAILQPPFFDPHADPAVNYGAIGAVIGHEMGHGFDDQGSKVDARGVQRNWWTDDDRRRFDARTRELVAQYDKYSPVPGEKINGEFTQGENIGDLGGLSIAYHAYKLSLKGREAPVIDGLTGDQRFFLSWAQVWRAKNRDEYMVMRLKSDPHSPEEFRVNGVVRNMDGWYAAFDIKPGQGMFLEPARRVSIW